MGKSRFGVVEVRHEPGGRRFVVRLGAYEASLMYAEEGQEWDFYHIYVPDPFRNQGIRENQNEAMAYPLG